MMWSPREVVTGAAPLVDDPGFPAPSRLSALRHRWPTAFAVLLALATAGDDGDGSITGLAEALVLFPLATCSLL
jgi:hypothetical protein